MRLFLSILFLAGSIYPASKAQAVEQELWRYPCDVFLRSACFRLPVGMTSTYAVPADFGVHEIKSSSGHLLSVYVGTLQQRSVLLAEPAFQVESENHVLRAFVSQVEGEEQLDVYILSKGVRADTVHVIAALSRSNRDSVIRFLAGLRPCYPRDGRQFDCPGESSWGQQITVWLRGIEPASEPEG
jgi:hypothetical protein